ncbi:MAG TPA: glycosyltransferase [Patescibacteria group bacterium]|nr:glycosyltransferase [Patescibacteria group bacterium]
MTIDICLPAYNEQLILKKNTIKILNYLNNLENYFNWHIYIVVNGSSDNSVNIAKEISNKNARVSFYELKQGGKGRAIKYLWQKSEADYFIYMDIDLAVSLESLPFLVKHLKNGYDLVWGSRHLRKSEVKRNMFRSFSSLAYNVFSKTMLNHSYSDLQCGFKGINNNIKDSVLPKIEDNNWFFDTELIVWSENLDYKLKEIPVNWQEDRYQERKSKVKIFKDAKSFMYKTIKLRERLKGYKKIKQEQKQYEK